MAQVDAPADQARARRLATIDRYLADLRELERYEAEAEQDLARATSAPGWRPTAYETAYLPGLRLAGIEEREQVVLQNVADLHLHTQWSDGDDLDRVLARALEARLDVIAVTDHDEIEGALEARRRAHQRRLKIAVVPGIEVSSRDGHIGGLFVTRKIPAGLSAAETVERIHAEGGIAVAHHPYAPRWIEKLLGARLGCGDLIKSVPFDAIECTNAVPGFATRYNIAAQRAMHEQHIRVAITGSSDAHTATLVGKGRTYFAGNTGVSSLLLNLRHGLALGAEGYWTTREKLSYRLCLCKALLRNVVRRRGSIN